MPEILIIAGPNGAGKTTFASEYLPADKAHYAFVNADEIARTLPAPQSDILAARAMLKRIDELVRTGDDFGIETTLASLIYARKIPRWQEQGYVVTLAYLRLPSLAASLARVKKRVAAGGHAIPEAVIRRRFAKSQSHFEAIYKPLVDVWYLYESRNGSFIPVESSDDR